MDGQTERLNQFLEYYLRSYYNFEQDDWVIKLFLVEFVYNTLRHSSTGTIPASAFLGFDSRGPADLPAFMKIDRALTVEDCAKQLRDSKENVINLLRYNQVAYKKWYNRKRTPISF